MKLINLVIDAKNKLLSSTDMITVIQKRKSLNSKINLSIWISDVCNGMYVNTIFKTILKHRKDVY